MAAKRSTKRCVGALLAPAAVGLARLGHGRGERQQAADGVARAVDGARLDQLGNRVQRHHHGGLGPLADQEGAGDGHRHQRRNAQLATRQRRQPLAVDAKARQADGQRRHRHAGDLPGAGVGGGKVDRLGPQRQQQGGGQLGGLAALAAAGVGGAGRLAQALGFQAGGGDGLLDGRPGAVGRVHRQRARAQVEAQAAHRGLALQRAADLCLLAGAVHVGNAQQQGAARRQRREVDRPRRHFTGGAAAIGVGVGMGVIVVVVVPMSMRMTVRVDVGVGGAAAHGTFQWRSVGPSGILKTL